MKKTLTVLLLLILLLIASIAFLRFRPTLAPLPLKPALSWIQNTQEDLTVQFIGWRNRLLGIPGPTVAANQAPTAVMSDSASATELTRVDIGRSDIARVDIDDLGRTTITTDVADVHDNIQPAEESSVAGTPSEGLATVQPVDSNLALAALTDTEDVISRADAAIAAADAALARAQGLASEPAADTTGSRPAQATAGGSVAGGATVVLSQATPSLSLQSASSSRPLDVALADAPIREAPVARPVSKSRPVARAAPEPQIRTQTPSATSADPVARPVFKPLPARSSSPSIRPAPLRLSALPAGALAAPQVIPPDAPLPPLPVTPEGRQQQATISNFLSGRVVEFETGRDVLTNGGQRALTRLLEIIQANQDTIITIQGHTDNVGDEASNLELSSARSIRARAFLVARGVAPARLRVQAFGERQPIASNRTVQGRIRNRRIDFAVSDR